MQESERLIYHDIVNSCYKVFIKDRPYVEFSDEWWESLISDFDKIRAKYHGTDFKELVNKLTMELQDQHERRQKDVKCGS